MRRAAVRWLVNLLLAAASLAVACALAELAARAIVAKRRSALITGHGSISRYHPLLGWDKPPGAQVRLRRPEYDVLVQINSHGLRGPDRDYAKPAGVRRVLLLGDSFAEGYTVAEEASLRAVLERLLNEEAACGRHEVINAGIAAYSTDQEYLFFRQEAYKYGADVVVLVFFYNDLYYNTAPATVLGEGKPYFDLDGERLVLRNSPVPAPEGDPLRVPETRPYRLKPWRGSMALRLLSNRTVEGNPALHRFLARLGLVEPRPEEDPPIEMWPFGVRRREVDDMWARTRALLRALAEEVHGRGARLVVLYAPSRFEVNDRAWDLTRDRYRLGRRWQRERVAERLAEVCRELSLPLVDPRAALHEAEDAGRGGYHPRDGHWNETGHAIAARVVAPQVAAQEGCRTFPGTSVAHDAHTAGTVR
ncbi:MAG TPA: SGNH/GDSL hydrolase family protein [Vicinamibacteria bacterium]|nr:SGNH/GDSL hydrolase family protein [Vicinamibacteria bacterium]